LKIESGGEIVGTSSCGCPFDNLNPNKDIVNFTPCDSASLRKKIDISKPTHLLKTKRDGLYKV